MRLKEEATRSQARWLDLTLYQRFEHVIVLILTLIIAVVIVAKRSLLVVTERRETVIQVRAVVLLALLAIVRKLIILDLSSTEAPQIFALAAAVLALGGVYWLVREQDRRAAG